MAANLVMRVWARARHRRAQPDVRVTLVLADGHEVAIAPETALARSMAQVAGLLAHW